MEVSSRKIHSFKSMNQIKAGCGSRLGHVTKLGGVLAEGSLFSGFLWQRFSLSSQFQIKTHDWNSQRNPMPISSNHCWPDQQLLQILFFCYLLTSSYFTGHLSVCVREVIPVMERTLKVGCCSTFEALWWKKSSNFWVCNFSLSSCCLTYLTRGTFAGQGLFLHRLAQLTNVTHLYYYYRTNRKLQKDALKWTNHTKKKKKAEL